MSRRFLLLLVIILLIIPAAAFAQNAQNDGRYLVKFKEFRGAADAVRGLGGRVALELEPQRAIAAYLPAAALEGLQHNPNVEYVEIDAPRYPMAQTVPYGITMVQAPQVSASNAGACMVCIIDSGYYVAHDDLQDSNVTGDNDSGTGNWFEDTCGHGSHVAGTISALDNSLGVVGVLGNGAIRLQIEKVFNGSGCGWAYSSTLVNALNKCRNAATSAGKKLVVSMSLGGATYVSTENTAFQDAYNNGVLSIAAAGNGGNTATSYPAGYASVMSVAAVDSTKTVASFSQKNSDVEIAAPGVGVLSTVPFAAVDLTVDGNQYMGANIDGSARTNATGALVNGGLCTAAGSWSGKVVLCQRGTNSFADKTLNVKNGGGVAAAIYNNVSGNFAGTLNGTSTIPSISLSMEDGQYLVANKIGASGTVHNTAGTGSGYEAWDGTSMATPHVSAVAALVWSNFPTKTNADIRSALQQSAQDLGTAGRDTSYGYGLVQAKAAYDLLNGGTPPPPAGITLSVTKVKVKKSNYADLNWSNATGATVNIFRNNVQTVTGTANDGAYRDGPLNRGTYSYKVCTSDNSVCSNTVSVTY